MYVHYDPDEFKAVGSQHTCSFHKANPGKPYAGCTCSASWGSVRRPPEEVAAIKAERRQKEEEEILAKADAIRARRVSE